MANAYKKFTTPVGIAKYPALTVPDTKFNALGVYKTGLIVDAAEAQDLIASLDKILSDYIAEQNAEATPQMKAKLAKYNVKDVCEQELDDSGEATGNVVFNFKLNAVVQTKAGESFEQTVKIFDTSNKLVSPDGLKLWGGSQIAIAGEVIPYGMASSQTFGISLRLKAVQIVSLKSGSDSSGDSFGFAAGNEGFVAPTFEESAPATETVTDDDF